MTNFFFHSLDHKMQLSTKAVNLFEMDRSFIAPKLISSIFDAKNRKFDRKPRKGVFRQTKYFLRRMKPLNYKDGFSEDEEIAPPIRTAAPPKLRASNRRKIFNRRHTIAVSSDEVAKTESPQQVLGRMFETSSRLLKNYRIPKRRISMDGTTATRNTGAPTSSANEMFDLKKVLKKAEFDNNQFMITTNKAETLTRTDESYNSYKNLGTIENISNRLENKFSSSETVTRSQKYESSQKLSRTFMVVESQLEKVDSQKDETPILAKTRTPEETATLASIMTLGTTATLTATPILEAATTLAGNPTLVATPTLSIIPTSAITQTSATALTLPATATLAASSTLVANSTSAEKTPSTKTITIIESRKLANARKMVRAESRWDKKVWEPRNDLNKTQNFQTIADIKNIEPQKFVSEISTNILNSADMVSESCSMGSEKIQSSADGSFEPKVPELKLPLKPKSKKIVSQEKSILVNETSLADQTTSAKRDQQVEDSRGRKRERKFPLKLSKYFFFI